MNDEPLPDVATLSSLIPGVERMLEWMKANPTLLCPLDLDLRVLLLSGKDQKTHLAAYARSVGKATVSHLSDYIQVSHSFAPRVGFTVTADRVSVCTRRVTGKEEVPEQTIPAHTREIVEWDCGSILAPDSPPIGSSIDVID